MWAHFGLGASDKGKARSDEVVRHLCAKHVVPKGGNNSNLLSHLRVHHPLNFAEVQSCRSEGVRRRTVKLDFEFEGIRTANH